MIIGSSKYHFPPNQPWFSQLSIEVDLGHQGIVKDYACQSVGQPKKKPKGGELTAEEEAANRTKSSTRIRIEHAISGLKRYRYNISITPIQNTYFVLKVRQSAN